MIQYYVTDKGEARLHEALTRSEEGSQRVDPPILVLAMLHRGWTTEDLLKSAEESLGGRAAREEVPRILKAMERHGLIAKDVPLDDASLEENGTDLPDVFKRNFPENI